MGAWMGMFDDILIVWAAILNLSYKGFTIAEKGNLQISKGALDFMGILLPGAPSPSHVEMTSPQHSLPPEPCGFESEYFRKSMNMQI